MFLVCSDRGVLISAGQEKITLILVNGNYAWPKGGTEARSNLHKIALFSASSFSHNELTSLLTKYEECLL